MKLEIKTLSVDRVMPPDAPGIFAQIRQKVPSSMEMHSHDFFELGLVRAGVGVHITEEGEFPIRRGDVFLLAPGEAHCYRDRRGMEIYCVIHHPDRLLFDWTVLQDNPSYQGFFKIPPLLPADFRFRNALRLEDKDMLEAETLIREMELESLRQESGWQFAVTADFMKLILLILRAGTTEASANWELRRISEILRYLDAHPSRSWAIPELAREFGLSIRSFERLFKRSLRCTPVEYIARQRLARAAARLRECPWESVAEIAAASGFSDSNYFCKCFTKAYGISPGRYRF